MPIKTSVLSRIFCKYFVGINNIYTDFSVVPIKLFLQLKIIIYKGKINNI